MTTVPGNYNFVIRQGETLNTTVLWGDACLAPIDLTGFTAAFQAKRALSDDDLLIDLTTENGGIVLGGTAGTIQLLMSSAATTALVAGNGFYDLKVISGGDVVSYLLQGKLRVQEMVEP
jgi:hypothetical protein